MMLEIEGLARPFQRGSYALGVNNAKSLKTGIDCPFQAFNASANKLLVDISNRLPWMAKTDEVLWSFKKRVDKMEGTKNIFYHMREEPDHKPIGYVTEIQVAIPDSNSKLEYQIYEAFGELLRTSGPLLFDLHIVKLRGRKL